MRQIPLDYGENGKNSLPNETIEISEIQESDSKTPIKTPTGQNASYATYYKGLTGHIISDETTIHQPKPLPILNDRQLGQFWALIDKRGPDECWNWKGSCNVRKYSTNRYPQWNVRTNGVHRNIRPYRMAYELERGSLPPELTIDHLCHNIICCNPGHLELVMLEVNISRRKRSTTPYKYRKPEEQSPRPALSEVGRCNADTPAAPLSLEGRL